MSTPHRQTATAHEPRTPASTIRRRLRHASLLLALTAVFAFHFRPWEVGYMEEWPLAADWTSGAGAFTADYLSWTLSRPFHLLPTMLGLALTNGAPGGIFVVLAFVAAAQLAAVMWALRPVARSFWVSLAVGLFLSLHPLWAGGFLQRFLPAQAAVLSLAFAAGMLIRWFWHGRTRWLVGACATLLGGFLVYPGPAVVAPMLALVIALAMPGTIRQRVIAVGSVTAASALMTLYSLVIARLISPSGSSYELANIEQAAVSGPRQFLDLVGATMLNHGESLLLATAVIVALGAALGLSGAIPNPSGWLMGGMAIASPVTTIVYFGHVGWLQDIDRLGYVYSLALFAALLVWPIAAGPVRIRLQIAAAGLLTATSLVGAIAGVQHWQRDVELQHLLLNELAPLVGAAADGDIIVVIDRSNTYGRMETFPLQYLASASRVWTGDSTMVRLCFDPSAVPSGGVVCDSLITGADLEPLISIPMESGTVDVLLGHKEPDD